RTAAVLALVAALGIAGCGGGRDGDPDDAAATTTTVAPGPPSTAAPTTVPTTSTTTPPPTVPPTTTTTTIPGPPTYRTGDEGPAVAMLQARLQELGFWVPAADGRYGGVTQQAVMAFQKHVGLARDGIAGPATQAALASAPPVASREGGDHLEIDLERQLLLVVRGGRTLAFNTSTGRAGWRTQPGRFTIEREIDGVRAAPLGDLYRPKYFDRGVAVHGSPSIPGHAASHGCARVHDDVMDLLWAEDLAPIGTPVWVY
ncbi:MAG TPA: L,D-transpeptidase family protein, partial [Acidimicrobiales bacterium]|nr:L,D-transpeptidase family protein [Acidimicrobiales bacterium]